MSHSLPETEEEMLKIVGVTKANFEKYGRQLLEITQEAAANKFGKKNCNRKLRSRYHVLTPSSLIKYLSKSIQILYKYSNTYFK